MRRMTRPSGRTTLGIAAGVVALAAVIFVLSAVSGGDPSTSGDSGAAQQTVESRLTSAEIRLATGDTTRAVAIAQEILATDPGNVRAQAIVSKAGRGSAPAPSAPTSPGSSPSDEPNSENPPPQVDDEAFSKEIEDIGALLPKAFEGYSMSEPVVMGGDADVSADPVSPDAPAYRVAWAVHDRQSNDGAESFIAKTSKVVYPKASSQKIVVDGAPAYFGTDGRELATVVYRRGRYVFEVVVVAKTQGDPSKLQPLAVLAAKEFVDTLDQ
ncbi:MAG: hypothetical protein U1E26_07540 [Coriobacteriia bacterium]|nr:hypothetical protein [Coriobacteriia bacterium]